MLQRVASLALVAALGAACSGTGAPPPSSSDSAGAVPDFLYLVHNQLWSIRRDGTHARHLTTVGDDAHRTGFPHRLPDGRAALLAYDTGAIYPYVGRSGPTSPPAGASAPSAAPT